MSASPLEINAINDAPSIITIISKGGKRENKTKKNLRNYDLVFFFPHEQDGGVVQGIAISGGGGG